MQDLLLMTQNPMGAPVGRQTQHLAVPAHVAIIMDGNGRFAKQRHHPRVWGHHQGVNSVREAVRTSVELGVRYLTLYAFSEENWKRPVEEVEMIFGLIDLYFAKDKAELMRNNVRFHMIGDGERLPPKTRRAVVDMVTATAGNSGLNLVVALNYGSRTEIARAARAVAEKVKSGEIDSVDIDAELLGSHMYLPEVPDPDLVIRTSGEQRISNFLLWQVAYAEFVFSPLMWPEFGREAFLNAVEQYTSRQRRFGGLQNVEPGMMAMDGVV